MKIEIKEVKDIDMMIVMKKGEIDTMIVMKKGEIDTTEVEVGVGAGAGAGTIPQGVKLLLI